MTVDLCRRLAPAALLVLLSVGLPRTARAQSDAVMPPIAPPVIPARVFTVTDYGAIGDGTTLCTAALQKAIDACGAAGGGTVRIPPGRFLTGPLTLTSGLNLRIEKGATLLLSDNPKDYPLRRSRFADCLSATDCHDIALTGAGTIDGQGAFWWTNYVLPKNAPAGTPAPAHRPYLIVLTRCTRVLVQDISLHDSPSFHLVPQQCRDVRIEGIHISAPEHSPNTDGIDPSGWDFLITGCTIDVGDDCIALKPSALIEAGRPSCENFLITDCTFRHGHGMSIGGQTPGGLRDMIVRGCTFDSTVAGIRMKAGRGSGGLVEDVTYENLTMKDVTTAILITSYYPRIPKAPGEDAAQPVDATTPIWRHIEIRHVSAEGGAVAGQIIGLPEMPVSDVTLTDVRIAARKGMEIIHAKDIRFSASSIASETGPPVTVTEATISGLDPARGR